MELTMDKAKSEFARGLLTAAEVVPHNDVGYKVKLTSALPADGIHYLLDFRRKQPRVFRSVDSALNTIRDIGFKTISMRAEA